MQFHTPHNRKPAWVFNRICAEERTLEPQEGAAGGRGYPALLEHMLSRFVSKRVQHKCSHIRSTQGRATVAASQTPPRNAILGLTNLGDLDINPERVLGARVHQPVSGSRQTSPGFHAAGSVCLQSSACHLGRSRWERAQPVGSAQATGAPGHCPRLGTLDGHGGGGCAPNISHPPRTARCPKLVPPMAPAEAEETEPWCESPVLAPPRVTFAAILLTKEGHSTKLKVICKEAVPW
ncbi:unnamed protein product [Nyctereutes procyonoides]|uniref:(raccoon dog) hypothetical protein n=1 Tax=Nyctereutes procyonoides TaxID=34880 RepID=A0A811YW95_NYCPR|nr:unnamed protein product [Nyctereutes procyonoides]